MQALKLAVLGFGNMGEAIVRGLVTSMRTADDPSISIYDPAEARRAAGADLASVRWSAGAAEAVAGADVVLLAVKPQAMGELLGKIAPVAGGRLIVSVAAGITSQYMESRLPGTRVIRTMPNTPLLAGKGIVALCRGTTASANDLLIARLLFPGATLLEVQENLMDAVTALSGSGPAYFFAFVEALAAAAREQGFDAETAYRLAAGTFIGAAALLEHSGAPAAALRQRVTSPGGTTEAALEVLAERGLERMVREAVAAAIERGRELSEAVNQPTRS
jgi:pyrroline-5-carboxylate reductase